MRPSPIGWNDFACISLNDLMMCACAFSFFATAEERIFFLISSNFVEDRRNQQIPVFEKNVRCECVCVTNESRITENAVASVTAADEDEENKWIHINKGHKTLERSAQAKRDTAGAHGAIHLIDCEVSTLRSTALNTWLDARCLVVSLSIASISELSENNWRETNRQFDQWPWTVNRQSIVLIRCHLLD